MPTGAKLAVTPFGNPVTDNAICDWNPFSAAVVSFTVADALGDTVALMALAVSEKPGGGATVRLNGCELITPPPVPVTVKV
jgi:3-deoxy-D-manno-octulosonate 8-phosphate phosphatase KdsC-like HAD superfamily phosphatase